MARFLSIWLLIAYSVAILRPYLPFLEYQINLEYYQSVLCENQDRPELQCDGKCYLAKQLKKAAQAAMPEAPQAPDSPAAEDFLWARLHAHGLWLKTAMLLPQFHDNQSVTYFVYPLAPTPPPQA